MQRESKDEKAAILERYKNSGMSIKQFCLEAGTVALCVNIEVA